MAAAPDEIGADRIVPNDAQQRASQPRKPPSLIGFVKPGRDIDVGERAEAASEREGCEASKRAQAAKAVGPIGDLVVKNEIARHGDQGCDKLRCSEIRGSGPEPERSQRRNVDDKANRAHEREQHEPDRQQAAARVVGDKAKKIEADQWRQFRFAGDSLAKAVWRLDDLQLVACAQDDVDQDLEAVRRQPRREASDDVTADHEKPAHRIRDLRAHGPAKEPGAEIAEPPARRRQAAAFGLDADPRADRKVPLAPRQRSVHIGKDRFVMLKIAVDDRHEVGARGHPAFDDRARKAVTVDASQAAHVTVRAGKRERDVRRAVRRVIVDDNHLPRQPVERGFDAREEYGDVGGFPIGRNDDREGRRRNRRRLVRRHFDSHAYK